MTLYTHPKIKEILHNLFRKVMQKYETGDNYYLIFVLKNFFFFFNKKYKNFMKNTKRNMSHIDELNNRISYLWNARMYYC